MKIFSHLESFPSDLYNAVIVIGNFDGVHLGHQGLLAQARQIASSKGVKWGVLTFEPHPRSLFQPDTQPYRITPPDLKAWRIEQSGADFIVSLPFDWSFAGQSPEVFINQILKLALQAGHIVVGYDFRFGQFRKGDPLDIRNAGLDLTIVNEVADEGEGEISSSRVRHLVRRGQIDTANKILGWNWEMRGTVVKGDQRGRELGYPTANFALGEIVHPAYGIYAANVQIVGEETWHEAAVNIGIRPMFELKTAQVESFIFEFNREIYGKILRVQPVRYLRSEAKFESLDALQAQMAKDCEAAKEALKG